MRLVLTSKNFDNLFNGLVDQVNELIKLAESKHEANIATKDLPNHILVNEDNNINKCRWSKTIPKDLIQKNSYSISDIKKLILDKKITVNTRDGLFELKLKTGSGYKDWGILSSNASKKLTSVDENGFLNSIAFGDGILLLKNGKFSFRHALTFDDFGMDGKEEFLELTINKSDKKFSPTNPELDQVMEDIEIDWLDNKNDFLFKIDIKLNNQIIGDSRFYKFLNKTDTILHLYIKPEYRKRWLNETIKDELLEELVQKAKEFGIKRVFSQALLPVSKRMLEFFGFECYHSSVKEHLYFKEIK